MIPLSQPDITDKEIDSVVEILKSGWLALGPKLKEFESIGSRIGNTKYASAVNSGTSGLHLIVKSLGIGKEDAVFTPSFTFIASANCFIYEGAYPLFVDIEEDTYNLDPKYIIDYISNNCNFDGIKLIDNNTGKHIKAIVGVHVFGHPFLIDEIKEICNKYNLYLIEDSAEAIGSEYKGAKVGQFGEASIFAFYPNKQLTTGEGGIITTNNENYYKLFESLKNQGRGDSMQWLTHDKLGYNYRLSEINAGIGIEQFKRLDEIIGKRNTVASIYDSIFIKFPELLKIPTIKDYCTKISRFVYVIEIKKDFDISEIIKYLKEKGIQSKNYFSPVHLQEFFIKEYKSNTLNLPITNNISKRTLAIPFYNSLQKEEIKYIAENIIKFLKTK